jgi:hypothetical protein
MSLSAQLISEQLEEILQNRMNMDKSARKVQEQVEDFVEVLDPEQTSSLLNSISNWSR